MRLRTLAEATRYIPIGSDGTVYGGDYALCPQSADPNGTVKCQLTIANLVVGADGTLYGSGPGVDAYGAMKPCGAVNWQFQAGANCHSPAIGADGTIYFGCEDNFLYALGADGSYRWRFETGGPIISSPVIAADGTIYVCSQDGNLYAIRGDSISATSPWPMLGRDLRRSGRVTCPAGLPCFDTERVTTNGAFDMVLIGKPGTTYGLEASTDLRAWSRLTNCASANGAIHLVDGEATNYPARFYRATAP